jgi:hypothetical protein
MAVEIYDFAITIPAGTAKSAGFSAKMTMPVREVVLIEVRVPPGPRGEMGFGIGASGTIVLPQGGTTYFIMDDQFRSFTLDNAITSGAWVAFGYNTGSFDHTVYVTMHVTLPYAAEAPATTPVTVPVGDLNGGGSVPVTPPVTTPPVEIPPIETPPPVAPPPVTTPPSSGPPLLLPPSLPVAPGSAAPQVSSEVDELMVGAGSTGTVWLLDERGYSQLTSQDDLDALTGAGVPSVALSDAAHTALLGAAGHAVSVDLGSESLDGHLVLTRGASTSQVSAGIVTS